MQDMLGNELKKDDIIVYDDFIYKVVRSHKNSIKYTNGTWVAGTSMSRAILKISDFDVNKLNEKVDSIPYDSLNRYEEPEPQQVIKTDAQRELEATERKRRNGLKKETRKGSIITDNNNNYYVYLGEHVDEENKSTHAYLKLGWYSSYGSRNLLSQAQDRLANLVSSERRTHWFYGIQKVKNMKLPNDIVNDEADAIYGLVQAISRTEHNTGERVREVLNRIRD